MVFEVLGFFEILARKAVLPVGARVGPQHHVKWYHFAVSMHFFRSKSEFHIHSPS